MKKNLLIVSLLVCSAFLAGCATTVKVTSEPAGAIVRLRGEGRAAFRWKTGPTLTPCEMDVYYGRVSVYVIWPDEQQNGAGKINGVKSEKKELDLSATRDVETVHFVKP